MCDGDGLTRNDGGEVSELTLTVRVLLRDCKPCAFCPAGEIMKAAYDSLAEEWSNPMYHRDGRLLEAGLSKTP